jgi:anti-sigma factor RsiW
VPEHLVTMIRASGALRAEREGERTTGQVVPFPPKSEPAKRTWSYGPLAAAASIALVIAGGGLLYQNHVFDQERQRLQAELTSAETTLTERAGELQELQTEQATQERRLAALVDKNGKLGQQIEETSQQVAAAEAERDLLAGELQSARAAVESTLASADADREALLADVADLNSQLTTKQQQVDDLSAELTSTVDQARTTAVSLAELRDDHQALETRFAVLGSNNDSLAERLRMSEETLAVAEQQNATLVAEAAETENALSVAQAESEDARAQLELEKLALGEALEVGDQQLLEARTKLAEADQNATELTAERDALAGRIAQSRERIFALESDLNGAVGELAGLRTTNDRLLTETAQLREDGSWLNQVIGYHRGYAGTMKEVEITAEVEQQKGMLTKWLITMLGRGFTVPDLSAAGLTFIGGRVFFVNGMPTGQIAYHDREGQLTGFCFTPNSDGQESAPTQSQDNDLNLVSWTKNGIDYVLVGWADPAELGLVGTQLQRNYGDNI